MRSGAARACLWFACAAALTAVGSGCGSERSAERPGLRRVYCNLDVVIRSHPAWDRLSFDTPALPAMQQRGSDPINTAAIRPMRWPAEDFRQADGVEEEIQVRAQRQLDLLATQLGTSMDRRVDRHRIELEARMEASSALETASSDLSLAGEIKAFWVRHGAERTAAEVRLAALSTQLDSPVVLQEPVKQAVEAARWELAVLRAQEAALEREAISRIADSRDYRRSEMETEMSDFRAGEAALVGKTLAERRQRLLGEIGADRFLVGRFGGLPVAEGLPALTPSVVVAAQSSRRKSGFRTDALMQRIEKETRAAVERLAVDHNMAVQFTPDRATEDCTKWFADRLPFRGRAD